MDRSKLNYWIDVGMFLSFLVTAVTGIMLILFLPSGIRQGSYQVLWGMIKETWLKIHTLAGILMVVICIIHIILHWKWIVSMTKRIFKKKNSDKRGR